MCCSWHSLVGPENITWTLIPSFGIHSPLHLMETKKGPLARQVPLCLNDRAWGWKTLCCFFSAPLGLNKKWHMPWWTVMGVICLSNLGQVLCLWNFVSTQNFFSFLGCDISSLPSPTSFVGKLRATIVYIMWTASVTPPHPRLFHYLVQRLATIKIAVSTNDLQVQSPLCSLSHSHLMTSWLDVCIKQMWLAMRGLKQDRIAYSL